MKKINYSLIALAFIVMLFAASCGKDGAVGPAGAKGDTGAQGLVGPAGPVGANGKSGSVIYSGTTTPASTAGAAGDFYLDLTTGLLYGPKTTSGWGAGFSLKGATGAAGSKIYNGNGAPPATTGASGDFYLDKTAYMLYGPKTGSGWGVPVNLQGPEGNANVKTDTFTVSAANWAASSTGYMLETGSGGYTEYFMQGYVRSNNTITQDVLDNGMVLVYFTPSPTNNPNQWMPLPYQFPSFGTQYYTNFVYITAPGQVTVGFFFSKIDPAATLPAILSYVQTQDYKFKIVTVTGKTGAFMLAHHVNMKDYKEVSKALGLWQKDKL